MGAVFSGGGAVVSYDDGVQAAASGTTGTQRNEFTAAIKSVTSATTVGAVFLYDTSADSDGGKWRSKCKGLSWFDEASSATKSARGEFPAMALIVADNGDPDGTARTLKIYDLDDPAMPLWMQFDASSDGSKFLHNAAGTDISGVFALNGRIYASVIGGAYDKLINFAEDELVNVTTSSTGAMTMGQIANRNATGYTSWTTSLYPIEAIVNNVANDVAMTVLEGAEIGALGLPIPTVAVATDSSMSVILPNGTVTDSSNTKAKSSCAFDDVGRIFSGRNHATDSFVQISTPAQYHSDAFPDDTVVEEDHSSAGVANSPIFRGSNPVVAITDGGFAFGTDEALNVYKYNAGNRAESAVAYITSAYNTGYMVGDIRGAWLANNATDDKSVKNNDLSITGAVDEDSADGGTGELQRYFDFSASNYLTISDADQGSDFDFAAWTAGSEGDFSIMFWVKQSALNATHEDYVSRSDATNENHDWLMQKRPNEKIVWYHNSGGWAEVKESTGTIGTSWTQVAAVRRSGVFNWYLNGEFDSSVADTNSYTPAGGSALVVGRRLDSSYPAISASLSLLRISATAPTPQQIKEIYDAEKPLFAANAKCLLQSPHGSLSNAVNDLAFDKSTGLLAVAQTGSSHGVQLFRGLEMAEASSYEDSTDWSSSSTSLISTAGGVVAPYRSVTTGGVLVDLPALDVRAELNEGADKLPDDGKFHFSGVTDNTATPTIIGQIPVALNENVVVKARVTCKTHNFADLHSYYAEITSSFQRKIDGTFAISESFDDPSFSTTDFSGVASMDVTVSANAAPNTIKLTVTGHSSRIFVWTAEVEVQRISDKTYER